MAKRAYDQFCALSRALDVLGERWTLLIVRNLLLGPQRYTDLQEGLPGIGPHLLSARLKHLEEHGVVRRDRLPPPAGSAVYELTEAGRELQPALEVLFRFGLRTLRKPRRGEQIAPYSALLGFRSLFRPEAAAGLRATYEYRIGERVFRLDVDDGELEVRAEPAQRPDVVFISDVETFVALSSGRLSREEALRSGRIELQGEGPAIARAAGLFGFGR